MVDGRAELFAGGRPEAGAPPDLRQPEGIAVDASGGFYVADRSAGAVVRLDARGRVVARRHAEMTRPRVLVADRAGGLWVGADGTAEAPWQQAEGQIWHVSSEGVSRLVLRGPLPQALALSPGGNLLVADRHGSAIFALTRGPARRPIAHRRDAREVLCVATVTPETSARACGESFVVPSGGRPSR